MNRYNFVADDKKEIHILPNQLWVKKAYPHEAVIIMSYIGNNTYNCIPWVKQTQNNADWTLAGGSGIFELSISHLKQHYQYKPLTDLT
jgi:hypothetical protein